MRGLGLLALLALPALSCDSAGTGTIALSWQFADGRSCADASVFSVALETVAQPFGCGAGHAPAAVAATVPRSGTLSVRGLSGQGVELYRGRVALDQVAFTADSSDGGAAAVTVTLYATGAR